MDSLMDAASPERIAEAARERGALSVAFTYNDPVREGFTETFYFQQTGGHLAPVLDTLQYLRHATNCWFEITTLLIPGHNDGDAEIEAMSRWIAEQLGPDVPLHFTAFHPDYKMLDVAPTPPATVKRARSIALRNGLNHVYTGNVHDVEGGTTFCPHCRAPLVRRDWYIVLDCELDARGECPHCGVAVAGRFGAFKRGFGRRRIPVRVAAATSN